MKFDEIIDEVAMSPTALKKFAAGSDAEGMLAGFEAEVIFAGANEDYYEDPYEDEWAGDTRMLSIDEMIEFFADGDNPASDDTLEKLRLDLDDRYDKWIDENTAEEFTDDLHDLIIWWATETNEFEEWTPEIQREAVERYLRAERYTNQEINQILDADKNANTDKNALREYQKALEEVQDSVLGEIVDEIISKSNKPENEKIIDSVRDYYREYKKEYDDDFSEETFLDDEDISWPSQITNEYYYMDWPNSVPQQGGFNSGSAEAVAVNFSNATGFKSKVYDHHGAPRPKNTYVFEPDPSIKPNDSDDLAVEIISPPMPLQQCIEQLNTFFKWAQRNDAYANESTGFHMSVSIPDHMAENIDFVKLTLFLGDQHVLEEFGRVGNDYCKSAFERIQSKLNQIEIEPVAEHMRTKLEEVAQKIGLGPDGFNDKYTTINPKEKYIEFRSAGGDDYFDDIENLQTTLSRYAQALKISSDPNAYREEYAKKFYKLISPNIEQTDMLAVFSRYMANEIETDQLKAAIRAQQHQRYEQANQQWWQVDYVGTSNTLVSLKQAAKQEPTIVAAPNAEAAIDRAKKRRGWGSRRGTTEFVARPIAQYTPGSETPAAKYSHPHTEKIAYKEDPRNAQMYAVYNKEHPDKVIKVAATDEADARKFAQDKNFKENPWNDIGLLWFDGDLVVKKLANERPKSADIKTLDPEDPPF